VPIQVMHVGLGPIGASIAADVAARRGLRIVGAVDLDPARVGRDLGEVCALGRRLRVRVSDDVARTVRAAKPDIAVLATESSLTAAFPLIETVLKLKVPIVSTTEELAYPVPKTAALARRIDALAKRSRVAVLGTGVNPGFVMDALPIALTAACRRVDAIAVERVQDARMRRVPFQRKIGAGLSEEAFAARVADGTVRHVGLAQSIAMIADAMGWKLDRITDEVRPKLAEHAVSSAAVQVAAGQAAGLIQDGIGYRRGEPIITLHMEAYLGAPDPYDAVRIAGDPPLVCRMAGGVHGDIATAAVIVSEIPKVVKAPPGLRTMRDMILPGYA
jgi:4-hydroxy-tetrahydrodipicolinate reductase